MAPRSASRTTRRPQSWGSTSRCSQRREMSKLDGAQALFAERSAPGPDTRPRCWDLQPCATPVTCEWLPERPTEVNRWLSAGTVDSLTVRSSIRRCSALTVISDEA